MSSSPETSSKRTLGVLVFALIVDMLAFTCILPLFPKLLHFYSTEGHRDWLYDGFVYLVNAFQSAIGAPLNEKYHNVFFGGFIGSLFCALQFFSAPTLGAYSDVYGRRTMLMVSCLGTLISYIIWLRSETFTLFVISRIVGGLSKSNINVATAIVSDIFTPEDHPKGMALIGIAYSIGFLIGPMIGAYFSTIAPTDAFFSTPAVFSICLTVLHFAILFCLLPETLEFEKRKTPEQVAKKGKMLISPGELFQFSAVDAPLAKKAEMQKFGSVYFLYLFLFAGLEFTLPFLTHLRFNFDRQGNLKISENFCFSMQQGKIYLFTGLIMLPIQGRLVRKAPLEKQKRIAEYGITAIIPSYFIIATAHSVLQLYLGLVLYAFAAGTVVTCLTTCVSCIHTESDRGALTGVFRSLGALARAIGPICASGLFWLVGPTSAYTIGGVLLLAPLLLLKKIANPAAIKSD